MGTQRGPGRRVNALTLGVAVAAAMTGPPPLRPDTIPPAVTRAAAMHQPGDDAWIAEDKLQHLGMSFAATAFSYAGARTVLEPDPALVVAGSAALLAGIAKEIHDARSGRRFSFRDLAWDAAGVALGLTLAHRIR
jgi:uncharacterized protein YfiM (DUF2279 family)